MSERDTTAPDSTIGHLRTGGEASQQTLSRFRDHLRKQARASTDPEWARMSVGEDDPGHLVWRVDADGEETMTYDPGPNSRERHWVWTWQDDEWLPEEAD